MKREDIIKENYEYVTCNYDGKILVRIYKPYTMGHLPVDLIIMEAVSHKLNAGMPSKGHWSYIDANYGVWAAHIVLHRHGRICDFYVCALLIRPFSKEALEEYDKSAKLEETDRLQLMWDSRNFDVEGGYKITPHGDLPKRKGVRTYEQVLSVMNKWDDIEDMSV